MDHSRLLLGSKRDGRERTPECLACIPRSKHMAQKACVCVFTRGRDRERDREKGTLELRESAEAT